MFLCDYVCVMRLWGPSMSYNDIYRKCVDFAEAWRSNIHDRPGRSIDSTWDIYVRLSVLCMFECVLRVYFCESWMECIQNVGVYIKIGKVRDDFQRAPQEALKEGSKSCQDNALAMSINWTKRCLVCWQMAHWWWICWSKLNLGKSLPENIPRPNLQKPQTVRRWIYWGSMVSVGAGCKSLSSDCFI